MDQNEIIQCYDGLMQLAVSKCDSRTDAEDIVMDTMLAAFTYIRKGGTIDHPKTWLAHTLCHKFNDGLRKKYAAPVITCLGECAEAEEDGNFRNEEVYEEASDVRQELNHLAYITREVLIRYYFGKQSIADIAKGLEIPAGTVKSRLAAGRSQMKKGLEKMEARENCLPGKLYLSYGGSDGAKGEPMTLVEGDLIAQNLLILAYEKPLTVSELSKSIGIPAAYIEPIIEKLVDGELMVKTDGGRVYTDFIITFPGDKLAYFTPQQEFVSVHFETIWHIIRKMSADIAALPFVCALEKEKQIKLDRYAILKALQDFQYYGTGKVEKPLFPKRKDGGQWIAQAIAFEAGYNMNAYNASMDYTIYGGLRTTEEFVENGTVKVRLHEFDTNLWDSPHRYGGSPDLYFKYIISLLWNIHSGMYTDVNGVQSMTASGIPNEFIAYIPTLITLGLLGKTREGLKVAIPVLKKSEYEEVCSFIYRATENIKATIGGEFDAFVAGMKTPVPKHLKSVPELYRYSDATNYFVMSVVRKAYERGLHLQNINDCCPPVVMVYGKP